MSEIIEKPFEYLRRIGSGELFDRNDVRNWYAARRYVLDKLKDVAFTPDSSEHLHAVVTGDSPQMLAVVRQIALSAHYINFCEDSDYESHRNRTVITIVSKNVEIKSILEREENLCNLPKYCKYTGADNVSLNPESYIDIELQIVPEYDERSERENYVFSDCEFRDFCTRKEEEGIDIYSIDTLNAIYASRIYDIGFRIDNLPAENIHCASRYSMALDTFQYLKLSEDPKPLILSDVSYGIMTLREILSNIFCADCFDSRRLAIERIKSGTGEKIEKFWEQNNESLSRSEHARWVVEKLIMGYKPLSPQQRYKDECLSYDADKRKKYRRSLKRNAHNPTHIDLCSYNELRRINPDDLKYDSFLMLAIPKILSKI